MVLRRTRGAPLYVAALVFGITGVLLGIGLTEGPLRIAIIVAGLLAWIALEFVAYRLFNTQENKEAENQ